MEQFVEEKELKNISDFLATKGRVTKIKDTDKTISIMLSQAGVSGAIILGMIGAGIFGLASYGAYMKIFVEYDKYINASTHIGIYIMFVILAVTFIVAAIYCKRQSILDIMFLNDTTMMVNKLKIDIKENACYIDVFQQHYSSYGKRRLEWRLSISNNGYQKWYNLYLPEEYKKIIYVGFVKEEYFNNFNRRTDIEELKKFIYNFEYEDMVVNQKSERRNRALEFYEDYETYNKYRG